MNNIVQYKIVNITKKIELPIILDFLPSYFELLYKYNFKINEYKKDNIIAISKNEIYRFIHKEWKFDRFINKLENYIDSDYETDTTSSSSLSE